MKLVPLFLVGVLCVAFTGRAVADGSSDPVEKRSPVPLISPQKLVSMIQDGDSVTFIDVREPEEYAEGHIPGAINIPQRDFEARQDEIPRMGLVIPYCNMDFRGFTAARELETFGATVALMQERGINGWRAQGLPTAGGIGGLSETEALSRLKTTPVESLLGDTLSPRVKPTGVVREIEMEASEWFFAPNDLRIDAGDEVRLEIGVTKGHHYFVLPDFEVSEELREGETHVVRFVADRAGEFRFGSCEWDGAVLQVMKGRLTVLDSASQREE